ncbi:MAG: hypothetical protein A2W31_05455 [Planctomycetes bacterium RBG_16_64_10]|nr:MAG: hypothetical protein A2W31_05455 [Planctomycetes bacterium RBG_16_64_10]
MRTQMKRREFISLTVAGGAVCAATPGLLALGAAPESGAPVGPSCRKDHVQIARLYLGDPAKRAWPRPDLDFAAEMQRYGQEFAKLQAELADVDFVVDELVTSSQQAAALQDRLTGVDGVMVIHLSMGIDPILREVLRLGHPTVVFAEPYAGHEWVSFGTLQKQELGAKMGCLLTSDFRQLAVAVRPFRAIHQLRKAKILNVTAQPIGQYGELIQAKFGTTIQAIGLDRVLQACHAIDDQRAKTAAEQWIQGATAIVEPSKEEIFKSCKLALAFQQLLAEEGATVMTADCYGTMYRPLCQGYAFPCIGFTWLNDMGLGGICESDLQCAMTHIIFQGLCGRPGFISDPTVDEAQGSIILAHCLGTRKMDGPDGPAAPYKIRSIMERQQGAVAQVAMRTGEKVTQAKLVGTDRMPYFTGQIVAVPDVERGCRTKISVTVDGDVTALWKNWSHGLHRVTCYGDLTHELEQFCRFMGIQLWDEADPLAKPPVA